MGAPAVAGCTEAPQTQKEGPHSSSPHPHRPQGCSREHQNPSAEPRAERTTPQSWLFCPKLAHSWCTTLSAWLMDTGPSWRRRRHWKVVLSVPTSTSSFSCSLANSINTCRTQKWRNVHPLVLVRNSACCLASREEEEENNWHTCSKVDWEKLYSSKLKVRLAKDAER